MANFNPFRRFLGYVYGSMKIMRKKVVIFIVFLMVLCRFTPLWASDNLQQFCENLLEKDNIKGCIIVYDIKKDKIRTVTSPNIALKNYYPMGSVFKIITAFVMYDEKIINDSTRITCKNYYKIQNNDYICSKPGGHGEVNLSKAIAYSCSIYFYNFCGRLNGDNFIRSVRVLLDDKKNKCIIKKPSDVKSLADMSVGEGGFVLIRPIQMVNLIKHLIKEDIKIDKRYYIAVKMGMRLSSEDGTSQRAGINVAGKTGTPTDIKRKNKFHGWFIGWAPAKNPETAIVVFLEDGKGYEAAQIAGKVATEAQSLKHL